MFWQYFTKKVDVSDEDSRLALDLLYMSALGRNTIITKNIKIVSSLTFGERGENDMLLIRSACRILGLVSGGKHSITDTEPPFRIKINDPMWKDLLTILVNNFTKKIKFFYSALSATIDLIYKLCNLPIKLYENLIEDVMEKIKEHQDSSDSIEVFILIRLCQMLGEISLKFLIYLDSTVYREIKRRKYLKTEKKKTKDKKVVAVSASTSKRNESMISAISSMPEVTQYDFFSM